MASPRGRPSFASDDWMLEQQLRAEMEAEAWRRMRQEAAVAEAFANPPQAANQSSAIDHHRSGSAILKALVRFMLAAFAGYLAYLAGVDSRIGEFEIWLAVGAAFLVTLALSMFGAAREFVHTLAEGMRWILILSAGVACVWFAFNWPG
jgi:hypothetical protein